MKTLKNKPRVSVILPTYNRAYIIERAIDSVLNQSFKDFELIIIDDASTDNTFSIINKYVDKRIVYLKREINSCVEKVSARNDGIRIARGKYIAYIDSDNSWFKNHLKYLYEFIEHNKRLCFVYCDSWVWRYGIKRKERGFAEKMAVPFPFADTGEMFHKKKCAEKMGMWNFDGYFSDDWDFFRRFSKHHNIKHLRKILCNYYCSSHLKNAVAMFNMGVDAYRNNKAINKQVVNYLKLSIKESELHIGRNKNDTQKIEDAAKAMLLFGNHKGVFKII